jgi:hypothetical protein
MNDFGSQSVINWLIPGRTRLNAIQIFKQLWRYLESIKFNCYNWHYSYIWISISDTFLQKQITKGKEKLFICIESCHVLQEGINLRRDSLFHKVFRFQALGQSYIDFMWLRTNLKCPILSSIPYKTSCITAAFSWISASISSGNDAA